MTEQNKKNKRLQNKIDKEIEKAEKTLKEVNKEIEEFNKGD